MTAAYYMTVSPSPSLPSFGPISVLSVPFSAGLDSSSEDSELEDSDDESSDRSTKFDSALCLLADVLVAFEAALHLLLADFETPKSLQVLHVGMIPEYMSLLSFSWCFSSSSLDMIDHLHSPDLRADSRILSLSTDVILPGLLMGGSGQPMRSIPYLTKKNCYSCISFVAHCLQLR